MDQKKYKWKVRKKRIIFIALPIIATFVMSVGVFISRAKISGWLRFYGTNQYRSNAPGSFRIMARKGKHSEPVDKLDAKIYLSTPDADILIGQGEKVPASRATAVNVYFPRVKDGKYDLIWKIDSDMGKERWVTSVNLIKKPGDLKRYLESEAGGEDSNYESYSSSRVQKDSEGLVVSLHPYNSRGIKPRVRDMLFIKAQHADGKPARIKARLKLKSGIIRVPTHGDCVPFVVKKNLNDCMVEVKEGQSLPFDFNTDILGLDSMSFYAMTHSVSFTIAYHQVVDGKPKGPKSEIDFELGAIEDDTVIDFLPRILPANRKFSVNVMGFGRGPLYLDLYSDKAWNRGYVIPLQNYFGKIILDTSGLNGFYKLQYSLTYMPVVNLVANTTFYISEYPESPEIIHKMVNKATRLENLDQYTKKYLNYITKNRLAWKPGFKTSRDSHFFAGLLDQYHFAPTVMLDTKNINISKISKLQRNGQLIILGIMTISGVILILIIFFATFYSL
ncbi:MAG: hypothetical protein PF689_11145 [Deltaproteobacteria bacterium]|jgi:hypothetical protein|nr:hypothetical protein [Deltaproteobacteria bacterium]